jgi:hypothetical protein
MIFVPLKAEGGIKMSEDRFVEVTSKGWFSRIMESIKSVAVGLILFVVAFPLLFWNEGRAVRRAKTLETGAKQVITVKADAVDSANEGKLVHLTGLATTDETLSDSEFGVATNAIKLVRNVQMYQWKQTTESKTRKKIGGGEETVTEYKYDKVWSGDVIKSDEFKHPEGHSNPGSMAFESKKQTAQKVTLGAFVLSPSLVEEINKTEALPVTESTLAQLPRDTRERMKAISGMYYIGKNPTDPQIGELKISFEFVKPTTVSIVSRQVGNTFEPFMMDTGNIELLQMGTVSADSMFKQAQQENVFMTWILRLVGFIMMMIGITMVFKPLTVVADVLPILGDILGLGIGIFAGIVSLALSLLTISIAWVFYRPLIGIPLLIIAVGLIAVFFVIGKKKKAAAVAPAA